MQLREVFATVIAHVEGDIVPVWYNGEKVGYVTKVRPAYIIDDQEYTEVTVEIDDQALKMAIIEATETQAPVFQILFMRRASDFVDMTIRIQ